MAIKIAGGSKWWQVRAGGLEGEWIAMKRDYGEQVKEARDRRKSMYEGADAEGKGKGMGTGKSKEDEQEKEKEKAKSKGRDKDGVKDDGCTYSFPEHNYR